MAGTQPDGAVMQTILSQVTSLAERYRRASRPIVVFAILLPWLLFLGFVAYDYRVETSKAEAQIVATTDALAEHALTVVETADLALARVLDYIDDKDWQTITNSPDAHDFLVSLKQQLPQLESVFLVGPDGTNAASSRGYPLPPISNTGREYFKRAQGGDTNPFASV